MEGRDSSLGVSWMAGTPYGMLAVLASALVITAALTAAGVVPAAALRAVALTAGHGALLATALAWAATDDESADSRAAPIVVGALGTTMTITTIGLPHASVAYLLTPLVLLVLATRGGLRRLGLSAPVPVAGVLAGVSLGALLGAHVLLSTLLTQRYHVGTGGVAAYLAAVAYDAGANVPSSELFFRGALFNRLQRRASFAIAATGATAAMLGRYLIDPLLPKTPEILVGTVVYVSLLGVMNAWLFWRTGSLVPSLASALVFFAAWRLVLRS